MPKNNLAVQALRERALSHLKLTEQQLQFAAQITPQLRMIGNTLRRAGQPRVTTRAIGRGDSVFEERTYHAVPYGMGTNLLVSWPKYLQMIDDHDARQVLGAWAQVPSTLRASVPIEAYCLSANISPIRVLEMITAACVRLGAQASSVIAAINHPRVVEKTVEMALTDEGIEDRNTLHKATGFLPTAKGPSVVVNTSAVATAQTAIVQAPPPEQTIRRMVDRFNDARPTNALPATSAVDIPVVEHEPVPVEIEDE